MASVRLITYLLVCIAITIFAMLFIFRNDDVVAVDFFLFNLEVFSVGAWIVASFVLGNVMGWMISLPGRLGLKLTNRRRDRQLQSKEDELLRLKGESAK